MRFKFQRGAAHLFLVVAALALILGVAAFKNRQYVYMAYQHVAFTAGVNLNEISTGKYVAFIKSQTDQKQTQLSGVFLNQTFTYNELNSLQANVLGDSTSSNKRILIDISDQKLYMQESGNTVGTFLVSTGKWAPTPTGSFAIWTKLRYTTMAGGNPALGTYYNLPNVPYTMYFYQGYGIHGAYWHNNFGNPMSHGCVNMRPEEAGIVFNWANVGTPVIVQD